MTSKIYGRRFPSLDREEKQTTDYTIECANTLIFRTITNRTQNEDRIRGVF